MRQHNTSLTSFFKSVFLHRSLIMQMTKREVVGRYRGSAFGLLWSFFNPLIMLTVYTFIFGVVFQARWGLENESRLDFAIILFAGLTIFNLFGENISKAPMLVLSNVSYVKKVVFPIEILPLISFLSAFFHLMVSLSVLMALVIAIHGVPSWTVILLIPVLIPYSILIISASFVLAAIGVFIRDVGHMIGHLVMILMFTSPVFFSAERFPEKIKFLLMLNPLAVFLESAREVLIFGILPDFQSLGIYLVISLILLKLSYWFFQKTRNGFSDVL